MTELTEAVTLSEVLFAVLEDAKTVVPNERGVLVEADIGLVAGAVVVWLEGAAMDAQDVD